MAVHRIKTLLFFLIGALFALLALLAMMDERAVSADRDALVALYNATGGGNWTSNANWLTDAPLGEWHGVTTDEDGRVVALQLRKNGLSGALPSSLGDASALSELRKLRLSFNQLSGPIPDDLGRLSNLETLSLARSQLSGEIQEELGNLANLETLLLQGNELEGAIPAALTNLSNLENYSSRTTSSPGAYPRVWRM